MKLLMISGDRDLIKDKKGPFYYLLQEFSKHWERIDIICPSKNGGEKKFFSNVYLWGCPNNISSIYKKAEDIHIASKFNIMTVHDYPPFKHSKAARLISKKFKTPYLIEIHHVTGYPRAADLKEKLLRLYFEMNFKKVSVGAEAIRVVNQKQVPDFLNRIGIKKDKIVYLPSFYIDTKIFYPQNIKKKYDLLFVGRFVKNKGLNLLINILTQLKNERPDFSIAIVGDGPEGDKLKLRIKEEGLIDNVEFLGWLPDARALAQAYNQSKILLITSYNEGGPRVGLEAMSSGTPVISTRVGIMEDIIVNGLNGYLVDWQHANFIEKIKKCLGDKVLYENIIEHSKDIYKKYDYHKTIKDYAIVLKNLI